MRKRKSSTLIKFFTVLIVLMPLLSVYSFPGIASLTLGEPILIFCSILILLNVLNTRSGTKMQIIGGGPDLNRIESIAHEKIAGRYHFTEIIPYKYMGIIDYFSIPIHHYGLEEWMYEDKIS